MSRFVLSVTLGLALCASACLRAGYTAGSGVPFGAPDGAVDSTGGDAGPTVPPGCDKVTAEDAPGRPVDGIPLRVAAVAASHTHACAVTLTGELYCWGGNCGGQLGTGDLRPRALPFRVPLSGVDAVAVGNGHTCARAAAALLCWGLNDRGQLGLGDRTPRRTPQRVATLGAVEVISASDDTTCAIDSGALHCWGRNDEGQAAQLDEPTQPGEDHLAPERVGAASWSAVSVDEGHGCGIQRDGSLWCWGRNSDGHLGLGPDAHGQLREPQRVGEATSWIEVDTAPSGTCGRQRDNSLWCWGINDDLNLGFDERVTHYVPTQRAGQWNSVSLHTFHGCAIADDGALTCWGRAIEGQLGLHSVDPLPPRAVGEGSYSAVTVGRFTTFAVRADGVLTATGMNEGLLGLGTAQRPHAFLEVQRLP